MMLLKISSKGKYGITLYQPQDNYQILLPFVWQNGGDILDNKGRVIVDQPEFVEAFEYYTRFLQKSSHLLRRRKFIPRFCFRRYTYVFSGPWMVSMIREQIPQIEGKWNVALMPQKKTRTSFMGK